MGCFSYSLPYKRGEFRVYFVFLNQIFLSRQASQGTTSIKRNKLFWFELVKEHFAFRKL